MTFATLLTSGCEASLSQVDGKPGQRGGSHVGCQ